MNDEQQAHDAAAGGIWSRYTDGLGRDIAVDRHVIAKIRDALAPNASQRRETYVLRAGDPRIEHVGAHPEASAWDVRDRRGIVATARIADGVLTISTGLPIGVYEMRPQVPEAEGATPSANLIVAPERTHQGPKGRALRTWLIAVQLYGVRSRRNWGHGDFGDLAVLLDCAAHRGAGGIGLNPLHILFDDRPSHISPYSPNSRRFIEPLYIDVDRVAEFPGAEALHLGAEIARLRASEHVDYPGVRAIKFKALRACHAAFRTRAEGERRQDFETFRSECGPALRQFACFETLRHRFRQPWWQWPQEWRSPNEPALATLYASLPEEIEFHEYLQWIADRQLAACRTQAQQLGLPVGLYVDLAVGVVPDGADAWTSQATMLRGVSIGAPPDRINLQGQSWGLTTFSPTGLAESGFEPFRQMLSSAMRHAGAVRIDHVLGLNRLFLVPEGMSATEGTYLDFPLEAMLAVTAEQSQRHRCIVIGEDLGTVPEDFRARLARWGLWSYRVMQFERDWSGRFHPPQSYDENALVTFATHDLATFAGWWSGHDLAVRREIGLDPGDTDEQREGSRTALRHALSGDTPWTDGDVVSVARYLAATPSRLVVVTLEDILGSIDQPNIPGSIDEYPNWRMRPPVMVEDLASHGRLMEIAAAMRAAGRSAGSRPD